MLSWVLSGLFSMNPWGLMEGEGIGEDMQALSGEPPRWSDVRALIEGVAARAPANVRSLAGSSVTVLVKSVVAAKSRNEAVSRGTRRRGARWGHTPRWGAVGEAGIDWKGQIEALHRDGYRGYISLDTHWQGPGGDKHQGSILCGRNLKRLVAA